MATYDDLRACLDASAWLGVGVVGALVFLVGVYQPAWKHVPYADYLEVVVAIAGGASATLGLSFWWDQRETERRHPKRPPLRGRARDVAAIGPSLEIYRPGPVERPAVAGESNDLKDDGEETD